MEFRPLHPDLGAEVSGFDVQNGGSADEIAELRAAYDRYGLLLFRGGGRISPERHVEFTRWFGPPEPMTTHGGNPVSVLDNEDKAGSMRLPFHSDLTYTDLPIKAICLHAVALPERPTSTTFVSGRAAWRKLDPALQERLAGTTLRHFYESNVPEFNWPDFVAEHPLRLLHPRTGEPILLVTELHAQRILELSEEESRAVLDRLFAVLYADDARYVHQWQQDDLLMWDNLVNQHARTEESDPGKGSRTLQRVALCEQSLEQSVEHAREQAILRQAQDERV